MKHQAVAIIAVLVSLVLSTGTPNFAQSVADAARQERERKRQLALHALHVYTNEDLSKPHILVPEDEARVVGRQNEPVGTEAAANAAPATFEAAPAVSSVPAAAPEIKELATAPDLPEAPEAATNVVLPSGDSKFAPQMVARRPWRDVAAPIVADETPASPMVLSAPTNNTAALALPATASRPLVREARSRLQTPSPAPVADIKIPSTTMPFATPTAYGPASILPPAAASKPLVKEASNRVQTQAPAPVADIKIPSTSMPFVAPAAYGPASILPPAAISKPAVREASDRVQIQAPETTAEMKIPSNAMPFATSAAYGSANIVLPTTISRPLIKEASNRVQIQAPVPAADITTSSTTMPFATPVANGPVNIGMLAPTTPSVARELKRETKAEIVAPIVPSPAAAPVRLTLTEHSIVRPIEPVTKPASVPCARPCDARISPIAPSAVLVRTEVRPDIAKPALGTAAGILERNSSQAIIDTTAKLKIQPGDSLWRLAERYFGNGLRWKRLAALNPQLADPDRIRVGEWIRVPAERRQSAKQLVIQPGDTLWKVAQAELGSPLALNCIAEVNPKLRSVDVVRAGETVAVPEACGNVERAQN